MGPVPTPSPARKMLRSPEVPWILEAGEEGWHFLHFHSRWPAYEVVVDHLAGNGKRPPLLRLAAVPPRASLRLPTVPPAECDEPWLRLSWRDVPRGGPRRSQRPRTALLSTRVRMDSQLG
jgi:hypothetical protein